MCHKMVLWILFFLQASKCIADLAMEGASVSHELRSEMRPRPQASLTPKPGVFNRKQTAFGGATTILKVSPSGSSTPISDIPKGSETRLSEFLETIPQFAMEESILNLKKNMRYDTKGHENPKKNDLIIMKETLKCAMNGLDSTMKTNDGNAAKLQRHAERLEEICGSISSQVQWELLASRRQESSGERGQSLILPHQDLNSKVHLQIHGGYPFFTAEYPNSAETAELSEDVMGLIMKRRYEPPMRELNKILHDLNSFHEENSLLPADGVNKTATKLQSLVLQMTSYFYKHKCITKTELRDFFGDATLELAAINMITNFNFKHKLMTDYFGSKVILKNWDSSHFRTILEGLEDKQKRWFSYLALEAFFNQIVHTSSHDLLEEYSQPFKDRKFFNSLEDYIKASDLEKFKSENSHFNSIRQEISHLARDFLDDSIYVVNPEIRRFSSFVLNFVQENYGDELFPNGGPNSHLKEKLSFLTSNIEFQEEMYNLKNYVQENLVHQNLERNHEDNNFSLDGGDIMKYNEKINMLRQYYSLLLSKDPTRMKNESLKRFSLQGPIISLKHQIENGALYQGIPTRNHKEVTLHINQGYMSNFSFLQGLFQRSQEIVPINQGYMSNLSFLQVLFQRSQKKKIERKFSSE